MSLDLDIFFEKYEKLANACDEIFEKFIKTYTNEVKCRIGCTDCCYALFDLSLIEAAYINRKFHDVLPDDIKNKILEEADKVDRQIYKLKRWAFKERQKGVPEEEIIKEIGKKRIKCPLLSEDKKCYLYQYRPITCRLYGIPIAINNELKSCGLSGFMPGKKYQCVYLDRINEKLYFISTELISSIPTKYPELNKVLVPLSMALLTDYDENYFGIISCGESKTSGPSWIIGG